MLIIRPFHNVNKEATLYDDNDVCKLNDTRTEYVPNECRTDILKSYVLISTQDDKP